MHVISDRCCYSARRAKERRHFSPRGDEAREEFAFGLAVASGTSRGRAKYAAEPRKTAALRRDQTRELRGLVECRDEIGALDQRQRFLGQLGRDAEADVYGSQKSQLEVLVIDADSRLEGRNEVADHIFRGVVEERRKPQGLREPGLQRPHQLFDEEAMLGDGKGVRPKRLAVPAGDAARP